MTTTELKDIRKQKGWTQAEMAESLNTPFRTYQDWEAGISRIPGVVEIAIKCMKKKRKGKRSL